MMADAIETEVVSEDELQAIDAAMAMAGADSSVPEPAAKRQRPSVQTQQQEPQQKPMQFAVGKGRLSFDVERKAFQIEGECVPRKKHRNPLSVALPVAEWFKTGGLPFLVAGGIEGMNKINETKATKFEHFHYKDMSSPACRMTLGSNSSKQDWHLPLTFTAKPGGSHDDFWLLSGIGKNSTGTFIFFGCAGQSFSSELKCDVHFAVTFLKHSDARSSWRSFELSRQIASLAKANSPCCAPWNCKMPWRYSGALLARSWRPRACAQPAFPPLYMPWAGLKCELRRGEFGGIRALLLFEHQCWGCGCPLHTSLCKKYCPGRCYECRSKGSCDCDLRSLTMVSWGEEEPYASDTAEFCGGPQGRQCVLNAIPELVRITQEWRDTCPGSAFGGYGETDGRKDGFWDIVSADSRALQLMTDAGWVDDGDNWWLRSPDGDDEDDGDDNDEDGEAARPDHPVAAGRVAL